MKKIYLVTIFSLIFLFGLFIFKSIFYALILGLFYLVMIWLVNYTWQNKDSAGFQLFFKPVVNFLTASYLSLSLYCLVYLPISFLITEKLMIMPVVPSWIAIAFVFVTLVLLNIIEWREKLKEKKTFIFVFCFIVLNGLVYLEYRNEKLKREYLPKIYSISPEWGIQGQIVTIKGLNFGPTWKPGGISLGKDFYDKNMMAFRDWSENEIIFDQPVPKVFGNSKIFIVRFDGTISNGVDFEIRDPYSLR